MSDYSQITFFTPKDSLATGNPNKIIYGSDVDAELSAISTAIATKADVDGDAIGAGTPATELSVDNLKLDANKIISTNTDGDIELEPNGAGYVVITNADIDGGAIDGAIIGGATPAAITGTTLTANTSLALASGATVTAILDEDNLVSDSATALATQQSIKAYVDAQVTAQDLDVTTDSGTIAIDLDSETLTVAGGTGLDTSATGNTVTVAIDSTVATLTGAQTLTNKVLTSPDINTPDIDGGTIDGTVIGASSPAAATFTTGDFNTSLNVDGTITADGLTVGSSTLTESASDLIIDAADDLFLRANGQDAIRIFQDAGSLQNVGFRNATQDGSTFLVAGNGDISFYEDTGTTAKFFWDASAERLGLGTTSPSADLHISGGDTSFRMDSSTNDYFLIDSDGTATRLAARNDSAGSGELTFITTSAGSASEAMRIDSSGNVITGSATANASDAVTLRQDGTAHVNNAQFSNGNGSAGGTTPSIYSPASATLAISTNSSERLRVDGSGNVGLGNGAYIGTLSSAHSLSIQGGAGAPGGKITLYGGTGSNRIDFLIGASEAMRIDSSGNVGIGTSSPDTLMELRAANPVLTIRDTETSTASNDARLRLAETGVSDALGNYYDIGYIQGNLQFRYNTSEYMRLDDSGNWMLGTTDSNLFTSSTENGLYVTSTGQIRSSVNSVAAYLNRTGSDGDIVSFRKDGTAVGSIGIETTGLYVDGESGHTGLKFRGFDIIPRDGGADTDNGVALGGSALRFSDAYITNGVTTGSDGRDKQDIAELDEAERRVAVAAKSLLRKWRWKDAVAKKGDDARIHVGVIAQDLKAAFEAEGLDAGRYGMFMYDEWTDEETGEERSRMGVRYSELLAFIIAAL